MGENQRTFRKAIFVGLGALVTSVAVFVILKKPRKSHLTIVPDIELIKKLYNACEIPDEELAMKYIGLWKQRQYAPLITGKTPLHAASIIGDVFLVKVLVEEGICDVNAPYSSQGVDGITALHLAAEMGHVRAVNLLIGLGANIDVQLSSGQTPLMSACDRGHDDVVRVLLKAKASVSICVNGITCLYIALRQAISTKCPDVVEVLLSDAGSELNVDNISDDQQLNIPPICWAAENGFERVVELLIQRNCLLDVSTSDGRTPLMHALANGHHSIANILLKTDGSIFSRDSNGATALIYAIAAGYKDIVKYLLDRGVDPNAVFWVEEDVPVFALNICCESDSLEIAKMLLEAGANANPTLASSHPIIGAINANNLQLVQELLLFNAIIKPNNGIFYKNEPTPLELAIINENIPITDALLKSNQININEDSIFDDGSGESNIREICLALHFAASRGSVNMISYLIECGGAHLNQRNRSGFTALCIACKFNQPHSVNKLLEYGADFSLACDEGLTPLHYACMHSLDMVEVLIGKGADPNCNGGKEYELSPLHVACKYERADVVKFLLEKNSDPNSLWDGVEGRHTPLSLAYKTGHLHIVKMLIMSGADMTSLSSQLETMVSTSDVDTLGFILQKSTDSNFTNEILDWIRRSNNEKLKILIEQFGQNVQGEM